MKKLVLALVLAAIAVPAATAGGWATVGLGSLPPAGLKAGEDWPLEITVLQHGRTPLSGVHPTVTIRNLKTGAIGGTFAATPAGRPGVYRTVVRFPARGAWAYEVDDGFVTYGGAQTHTFKPVTIGAASTSSFPLLPLGAAGLLGLALLAVLVYRRRPEAAPRPAIPGH